VGHAVGAQRSPRQVGLVGIATGTGVMLVGAIAFALVPEPLVRIFSKDPAVVALGVTLLRIASLFQLFDGMQTVAAGALRGAGDVRVSSVVNVFAHWCVGFPIALVLMRDPAYGPRGIWWGLTTGLVTVSLLLTARFVWITRRQQTLSA